MVERGASNRIGQKGRTCHRWYERGVRPPGLADKRFASLYPFAACRPGTDQAFALALPEATATTMHLFLAGFAEQLEPAAHAALILDQAGWHGSRRLTVPGNITLLPRPASSPELKPVERVWLHLRERFLSHRVLDGYAAVLDAACRAWSSLAAEQGRLASLTAYPYLLRSEFP
jgi:hypothetical protein